MDIDIESTVTPLHIINNSTAATPSNTPDMAPPAFSGAPAPADTVPSTLPDAAPSTSPDTAPSNSLDAAPSNSQMRLGHRLWVQRRRHHWMQHRQCLRVQRCRRPWRGAHHFQFHPSLIQLFQLQRRPQVLQSWFHPLQQQQEDNPNMPYAPAVTRSTMHPDNRVNSDAVNAAKFIGNTSNAVGDADKLLTFNSPSAKGGIGKPFSFGPCLTVNTTAYK